MYYIHRHKNVAPNVGHGQYGETYDEKLQEKTVVRTQAWETEKKEETVVDVGESGSDVKSKGSGDASFVIRCINYTQETTR